MYDSVCLERSSRSTPDGGSEGPLRAGAQSRTAGEEMGRLGPIKGAVDGASLDTAGEAVGK